MVLFGEFILAMYYMYYPNTNAEPAKLRNIRSWFLFVRSLWLWWNILPGPKNYIVFYVIVVPVLKCFMQKWNNNKIPYLGQLQGHALCMTMACDDSDKRRWTKHSFAKGGKTIQLLVIRRSRRVFGRSINSNKFPRWVFGPIGEFSFVPFGDIDAHLVSYHIKAADQNGPITAPERPLSW